MYLFVQQVDTHLVDYKHFTRPSHRFGSYRVLIRLLAEYVVDYTDRYRYRKGLLLHKTGDIRVDLGRFGHRVSANLSLVLWSCLVMS